MKTKTNIISGMLLSSILLVSSAYANNEILNPLDSSGNNLGAVTTPYRNNTSPKYKSISSLVALDQAGAGHDEFAVAGADGKIYVSTTDIPVDSPNISVIQWKLLPYLGLFGNKGSNLQKLVTCGVPGRQFMLAVGDGGMAYALLYSAKVRTWSVYRITNALVKSNNFTSVACSGMLSDGSFNIIATANNSDVKMGYIYGGNVQMKNLNTFKLNPLEEYPANLNTVSYSGGSFIVGGGSLEHANEGVMYTTNIDSIHNWSNSVDEDSGSILYSKSASLKIGENTQYFIFLVGENGIIDYYNLKNGKSYKYLSFNTENVTIAANTIACTTDDCMFGYITTSTLSPKYLLVRKFTANGSPQMIGNKMYAYANSAGNSPLAASDIYFDPNLKTSAADPDGLYLMLYGDQVYSSPIGNTMFQRVLTQDIDPSWN